jgi:Dolichyl-phosphate-mannose-protein mannosyltransferase
MNLDRKQQAATLALIVLLGLVLRLRGLDRAGFNEDEVHKVEAAHSYLHGNFAANLEHPMLMKSLVAVSLATADLWNRGVGQSYQVTEEVAVRLPNVVFGSLTAVVIFLLAQEFLGVEVALLSALVWSIGTIPIMLNRLAKEDTLLVFFTWLAYYFYLRAKKAIKTDVRRGERFYAASGASFGLMLASKYFPHYLGLNFLYYYLVRDKEKIPRLRWRDAGLVFGACAVVFVLANPMILFPSTLRYMLHYLGEGTVTHHGYLMMGRLYFADPGRLRGGMPIYFYPLFLAIKTPLPILGAFIIGLAETWNRRREPGPFFLIFMFLFWIIPFSLLGSKWLRYMLSWMPVVSIIAAIGLVRIFSWLSALASSRMNRRLVPALAAAVALVFLVVPAWVSVKSAPYYSLYLNPLGLGRTGYYFPHDEVNDMGLREAIKQICERAPEGTSVGGEAEPVFAYYFHKFGRDDLHYFNLSDQVRRVEAPPSAYLVVQDGRKYFENIAFIQKVEAYQTPIQTFDIGGAPAARVYRDEAFAELRVAR